MRTVSIFKNGNNRAIRLPRDLDFDGVSELEIVREGDSIILRPVRPTWGSFAQLDR
ncbi:TPA: type II toxin-antitoxin system VapB family antitoxin, partial [Klebsiella pneumoniae]